MPTIVIGHRNPDTDAICSAIGYADLLRQTTTPKAEAAACGPLNSRSKFVLARAKLPPPRLVMDVRPTAGQLCRRNVLYARIHEPFIEVYRRMQQHAIREIPVVDEDGKLAGMLPLLDLFEVLLPDTDNLAEQRVVRTSLSRIRGVLGASFQHKVKSDETEAFVMMIGAMSADSFTERLHQFPAERILLVAGDRPTIQRPALEYGVRAIVVSGGHQVSEELLELAREKQVSILVSPLDTAMTALLIKTAKRIDEAVSKDYLTVPESMQLDELRDVVKPASQNLFPVMDEDEEMVGVLSKSDLVEPEAARLILVDHNEFGQAVTGADRAEIVEVIDHHRVGGGLVTREPIRFLNDPVGSTCTIVTRMYRQSALIPSPGIAICLASGIISDTLNLRSPTTTDVDRDMLSWLEPYTNLDLDAFVDELFASGSMLASSSTDQVLNTDCKLYSENGWNISVSQVEELGMERFWEREAELAAALDASVKEKQVDFACLMVTDITKQSSLLLTAGNEKVIDAITYPRKDQNLFKLAGVVSRKKQLLPHLMSVLSAVTKPAC